METSTKHERDSTILTAAPKNKKYAKDKTDSAVVVSFKINKLEYCTLFL
jgi:hypothetical protein